MSLPRRATLSTAQAASQAATAMIVLPESGPTREENCSQSFAAVLASAKAVRNPSTSTPNPAARKAAATGQKGLSPSVSSAAEPEEASGTASTFLTSSSLPGLRHLMGATLLMNAPKIPATPAVANAPTNKIVSDRRTP